MKRKFIAMLDGEQDPVFNSTTQNSFFPSIKAVKQGIKDEIEEWGDDGSDLSPSDFHIYKLIEVKNGRS